MTPNLNNSRGASSPFLIQPVLLLLLMQSLLAKPYGNYGFYSPYPPPRNQVLYDFRPLTSAPTLSSSSSSRAQSRETRDLTWKEEYDAFIDGKKEPTCQELREMWLLAREMQRRSLDSGDRDSSSKRRPFLSFAPLKSDMVKEVEPPTVSGRDAGGDTVVGKDSKEVELQVARNRFVPQLKADRRRMSSPKPPKDNVYGVVKTHSSPSSKLRVRDPAKEIYGLLREQSSSKARSKPAPPPIYSTGIRTHAPASTKESSNYLDQVKSAILAADAAADGSAFSQVRDLVSANRVRSHQRALSKSRGQSHRYGGGGGGRGGRVTTDSGSSAESPESASGDAFDLIRERLMNTRLPSSSHGLKSRNKSLRRKNSKKRRRNVSQLKKNLLTLCLLHA